MTARGGAKPDAVIAQIAEYVVRRRIASRRAYDTARYCLIDALACGLLALEDPECTKLLGPVATGTAVPKGVPVPGTKYRLDPQKAAFDIGTAIRWLDYNDAFFAAEGGHPSDNLGAILSVADYVGRAQRHRGRAPTVRDVLTALIKAYEIQGVLQLKNSLGAAGLDSTGFLNIASTAVATGLLGGGSDAVTSAVSNAWLDGVNPRMFRLGHDTGWRKSWASGDATRRGVFHAMLALQGEMGYPRALSAPRYGFCDALLRGKPVVLARPLGSYIVENILFKVPFPAQFHTQTATECALKLHALVRDRIDAVKAIHIRTHERTLQTADKRGPLGNAADRDHCLQYIVAVVLLKGGLEPGDYHDKAAADPRIDWLRAKMAIVEDKQFTRNFYDARKRSNANAMQIEFRDGSKTPEVCVDYPLGHVRRRREGLPLVEEKFRKAVERSFKPARARTILAFCADPQRLMRARVPAFMDLFAR